ncbi:hypothetical protein [Bradyrhizobium sp. WSM2254]|uniref:hypothetical protein n=1 Tax=Bradyrhizobium sp. WSM2254 TaxID=1188263 RepID=UPI000A020CE2
MVIPEGGELAVADCADKIQSKRSLSAEADGGCPAGNANETDLSTRCCDQIATATESDSVLSKPGLGSDECS